MQRDTETFKSDAMFFASNWFLPDSVSNQHLGSCTTVPVMTIYHFKFRSNRMVICKLLRTSAPNTSPVSATPTSLQSQTNCLLFLKYKSQSLPNKNKKKHRRHHWSRGTATSIQLLDDHDRLDSHCEAVDVVQLKPNIDDKYSGTLLSYTWTTFSGLPSEEYEW